MAHYRLYYLDATGHHIEDFAEFESPDDQSAIRQVNDVMTYGFAELWMRGRLIQKFGWALQHCPLNKQCSRSASAACDRLRRFDLT